MKREKLFEAIGGIKDKYLKKSEKHHVPFVNYSGWIACAACICIAVLAVLLMKPEADENVVINNNTVISPQLGLPSDTLPPDSDELSSIDSGSFFGIEGMGFEGYDQLGMKENLKLTPADAENTPESLPVFRNLSYNPYSLSYGLDEDELLRLVWDVLDGLGVDPFAKDLTKFEKERASDSPRDPRGYLIPDDSVISIRLTAGFGYITVYADGMVEIQWTNGVALPEEYSIKDDPEAAVQYLCTQYARLLDFEKPVINISERLYDYGISSSITVYDGAGEMTEQLLNYVYEKAQFYFDESGKLTMMRIHNYLSVTESMGYYPTISAKEAEKLLLDGIYYSTYTGEATVDKDHIRGVDLTYRTSDAERIWIPFYRFYIELAPNEYTGEVAYAAYYVPAIELEYIKTEYTPDFSFNN